MRRKERAFLDLCKSLEWCDLNKRSKFCSTSPLNRVVLLYLLGQGDRAQAQEEKELHLCKTWHPGVHPCGAIGRGLGPSVEAPGSQQASLVVLVQWEGEKGCLWQLLTPGTSRQLPAVSGFACQIPFPGFWVHTTFCLVFVLKWECRCYQGSAAWAVSSDLVSPEGVLILWIYCTGRFASSF